jgi:mannose-6-phosphate isomerase-like protein (cupin superfamily)
MAKPKIVPSGQGKHYRPSPSEDIYFIVTGDDTDGSFDHFDIRVGYLDGFPLHIHERQHETFHVLEGELRLQVDEQMIDAKTGDFLFIPMGVKHTYVNLKEERARAVGILTPGGFDKFVDEMLAYQQSLTGPPDPQKMAEISARHHQRQVGPPLAVKLGLKKGAAH